jgi:outer membrane protein assembly factor BamB
MGRVFLARSPGGWAVAVKVLRPEFAASADYRRRFAAEVAAAKGVVGLFTAPVVDADPLAAEPWLATVYVPGPTLQALVRTAGPMQEPELRALAAGLAEALIAIHAAGVLHRDLKPGNVLMSSEGPRVIDFGISKDLSFDDADASMPLGSVGYAAPEQVTGQYQAGPAADVFALGAVLVFAAGGRGPFGDTSPETYAYRVVHTAPDLGAVPHSMRSAVAACLSTDPAQRPALPRLLADLAPPEWPARQHGQQTTWLTGVRTETETQDSGPRTPQDSRQRTQAPHGPRRPTRRGLLAITGAVVAVAGVGAGIAAALEARHERSGGAAPQRATTTQFSESVAALPKAPAPTWATTADSPPGTGSIQLLGPTVIWSPFLMTSPDQLLAFDGATGAVLWSGVSKAPSLGTRVIEFLNISDSTLYGTATEVGLNSSQVSIFGLDAAGMQTVTGVVAAETGIIKGVWGDVVLATSGAQIGVQPAPLPSGGGNLGGFSLSDGSPLWSTGVVVPDTDLVTADASTCYYQDQTDTYASDLQSGAQRWRVRTTPLTPGILSVTDSALIVSSAGYIGAPSQIGMIALDPASGRQLWSKAGFALISVYGSRVYAKSLDTRNPLTDREIVSLDAASGRVVWSFTSPVSPSETMTLMPSQMGGYQFWASDEIVVFPYDTLSGTVSGKTVHSTEGESGFVVLDAATGKPLWAHQGSPDVQDDSVLSWPAAVSGDTLYAASATTLYAFKAGS